MSPPPSPSSLHLLTGNAPLTIVAEAAMSVVNGVQNIPEPGARLLGLACAFLLTAEEAGLSVPDLMGMARNAMNTAEGKRPEFTAVAAYLRNEVLNTF